MQEEKKKQRKCYKSFSIKRVVKQTHEKNLVILGQRPNFSWKYSPTAADRDNQNENVNPNIY